MSYKKENDCPVIHICSTRCAICFDEHKDCHFFHFGNCFTYNNVFLKEENNPIYFVKKMKEEGNGVRK
jgi:hypothetical protein